MVAISCFYKHFNRSPINFTFIQFEQYVKVILSLLCTEDTSVVSSQIVYGKIKWGIYTQWYWKNIEFTDYYEITEFNKTSSRNPLLAQEPKRASSNKKVKKFMKLFDHLLTEKIHDPNDIIREYYTPELLNLTNYFNRYIEHNTNNRQIQMLSQILHNYGHNVYSYVQKFI